MNKSSGSSSKWITRAVVMGVVLGGTALAVPRGAHADEIDDSLKGMKAQADCRIRCNQDSLSCMARCPNGNPGASCRANCLLDSSNCSSRCN